MEEGRRVLAGVCIMSVRLGRHKDICHTQKYVMK